MSLINTMESIVAGIVIISLGAIALYVTDSMPASVLLTAFVWGIVLGGEKPWMYDMLCKVGRALWKLIKPIATWFSPVMFAICVAQNVITGDGYTAFAFAFAFVMSLIAALT